MHTQLILLSQPETGRPFKTFGVWPVTVCVFDVNLGFSILCELALWSSVCVRECD